MTTNVKLAIERVNPLDHESEIKALFDAEGAAGAFFRPYFDRAYRVAVADGGSSWIGRDPTGRVVMHVACFPHRYLFEGRVLKGGVCGNLLVAREHRTFFPALALLRRLIADTREQDFDFLYGDPINPQSGAVFQAARFTILGHLVRYVLPVAGTTALESIAVMGYRTWNRVRRRRHRSRVTHHAANAFDASSWTTSTVGGTAIVPIHPDLVFTRRMAGYPSALDHWFTDVEDSAGVGAAMLVRGPSADRVATIFDIRRTKRASLTAVVAGAAAFMRPLGATRLQTWTLKESLLAAELRAAGLVPRTEVSAQVILPFSEAGAAAARHVSAWHITQIDCDR